MAVRPRAGDGPAYAARAAPPQGPVRGGAGPPGTVDREPHDPCPARAPKPPRAPERHRWRSGEPIRQAGLQEAAYPGIRTGL
ncbi:hypothetical protein MTP02_12530 [Streptomyces albus]|nr:hypothetical protein MTP02_12530 [Streptomyces albus]